MAVRHLTRTRLGLVLAVGAGVVLGAVFGQPGAGRAASAAVPTNKTLPTVTGTPESGQTLTATHGTWNGTPTSFSYAWSRCDATGNACAGIAGATAKIYTVTDTDVGHTLRVTVTARNADGAGHATSAPTGIVSTNGCPPGTGPVPIASLAPPARLMIGNESISPSVTRSTRMIHIRLQVTACNGRPVEGATVFASPIPYNQFKAESGATAADGTTTLSETRQSGFPVSRHQGLLAVLVRASKPGESALAGVSTVRLVSFRVSVSRH
jgi:hypothetical protein